MLLGIQDTFQVRIYLAKKFVNSFYDLRKFQLSSWLSYVPSGALFIILYYLKVLFFLLLGLFESHLHVFLLFELFKCLNTDDRLVGKPNLLTPVCKKQSRVSLILILLRCVESTDHTDFRMTCEWIFENSGQFRTSIRNELVGVVFSQGWNYVSQGG